MNWVATESTPLLGISPKYHGDNGDECSRVHRDHSQDRCSCCFLPVKWPCFCFASWSLLVQIALLLIVSFIVFELIIHNKMHQAWKQARIKNGGRGFQTASNYTMIPPLLIVHGVDITAREMDREASLLAQLIPGKYVESLEYAPGVVTYFTPLDVQLGTLCERLQQLAIFGKASEIDVLGHSSGAIMARAIAQNPKRCLIGRVRHYVGIAGPQQGVVAPVPGDTGTRLARTEWLDWIMVQLARTTFLQRYIVSTAAYLYNPRDQVDTIETNFGASSLIGHLNRGKFLAPADGGTISRRRTNSRQHDETITSKEHNSLLSITGNVLLIESMQDQVIRPPSSAFFSRYVGNQLLPVCQTDIWHCDAIGLQQLWSQQRLFFYESPTAHGPLPTLEYELVIAPWLSGGENSRSPPNRTASSITVVERPMVCGSTDGTEFFNTVTTRKSDKNETVLFQIVEML